MIMRGTFQLEGINIHTIIYSKNLSIQSVADTTDGLIKKVQVDYYADTNRQTAKREVRYIATPKALQDYNDDGVMKIQNQKQDFALTD